MAIAIDTKTLLPLDRFAAIVGLHPLHFNGVVIDNLPVCTKEMAQYTWQTADAISREELGIAIADAEQELNDYLGFPVAPMWVASEYLNTTQPHKRESFGWHRDSRGFWQAEKVRYGHVISGGSEQKDLIQAGAAVVYTDSDSDGYKETATISVPTAVTDPDQIAIYYPDHDGDGAWEIRPIKVTIAGGTATILCRREQLVKESLLVGLTFTKVLGTTDANFLDEVDVYRHYNDPQTQVEFQWRQAGCCGCLDAASSCASCSYVTQPGCISIKDYKLGLLSTSPGDWNVADQVFDVATFSECRQPDRLRLWYYVGYRDLSLSTPHSTMSREWARAVSLLALTKLDRPICSCHAVAQTMQRWTTDLRATVGTSARSAAYKVTNYEVENCPFGATTAGLEVWRLARRYALGV
jgi:hypothetical protein